MRSRVIDRSADLREPAGPDQLWADLTPHVPQREALKTNLIFSATADQSATPFDILRTKTQLLMRKNGWSRLGITSATPSCGKTTVACNLAAGFMRQSGMRTILFEFDLRRPSMARMIQATPKHDITDMLSGSVSFGEQAIRVGDNVAISMAQRPSSDPTAVLLSAQTHDKLAEIERDYGPDLTIFDLPPILVSDDTRAFLKDVDCVLIVAKAETTSVAQIDTCEREVAEQTNVLGVVLNQCRHAGDTDYGYAGYSYGT